MFWHSPQASAVDTLPPAATATLSAAVAARKDGAAAGAAAKNHKHSVRAPPLRIASVAVKATAVSAMRRRGEDREDMLLDVLNVCAAAEDRACAHFTSRIVRLPVRGSVDNDDDGTLDIPAALTVLDFKFPHDRPAYAPIIAVLTQCFPELTRSLQVLKISNNDFDESATLGAFAALATHLRELSFADCGITSLQGLEGRCKYLRKVNLFRCHRLKTTVVAAVARATAAAKAAGATPPRVAAITIHKIAFKPIRSIRCRGSQVAVLWRALDLCVIPAEQRASAHFKRDIPPALALLNVNFSPEKPRPKISTLGPLTTKYPALVRSLQELTIAYDIKFIRNDFDESAALAAFAEEATNLRELTFFGCGLTSVQGLEGRCEFLQKVVFAGCKDLKNLEGLEYHRYLKRVDASSTGITSIDRLLGSCRALTTVNLKDCTQLPADFGHLSTSVEVTR